MFRQFPDEAWLAVLKQSTEQRHVLGHPFPPFPSPEFQENFVGSSYEAALGEAFNFHQLVKGYAAALGRPLTRQTRFLDFGCGWGRYMRMFWKDFSEENMFGCDVNDRLMFMNRWMGLPGSYNGIKNGKPLPYADASFDCMIAYSVFTHLPDELGRRWMSELARVAKPGCVAVVTFWPERFLDYIAEEGPKGYSGWLEMLYGHRDKFPAMREQVRAGELAFLDNGGFELAKAEYGDSVLSPDYIRKAWGDAFELREVIDDPSRFVQGVAILQKR
jgi:SAM-dependent methyltransferase